MRKSPQTEGDVHAVVREFEITMANEDAHNGNESSVATRDLFQDDTSASRRARRYHDAFPETPLERIAAHLAVVSTGTALARAVNRHLEPFDINPARYSLLRALYFAPDRMLPQSEIAREMGTSQPNVTQLLHALEKEELVERIVFPENRRVTFARLTPEGEKRCAKLVPDMVQFMQACTEGLSEDEVLELYRLLTKVRHAISAVHDE